MLFVQVDEACSQTGVGVDSDCAVRTLIAVRPFVESETADSNRVNRHLSSCSNSLGDCSAGSLFIDLNRSTAIALNIQRQRVGSDFLLRLCWENFRIFVVTYPAAIAGMLKFRRGSGLRSVRALFLFLLQ